MEGAQLSRLEEGTVAWETCSEPGCIGASVGGERCLAHVAPVDREPLLRSAGKVDLRGARIDAELLGDVMRSFAAGDQRTRLPDACFEQADFIDEARFAGIEFGGAASFARARFRRKAAFSGAKFNRVADFRGATFAGVAEFGGAWFGKAVFSGAVFQQAANFSGAHWYRHANFSEARFAGRTLLNQARFFDIARFDAAHFGPVSFSDSEFKGLVSLREAEISGDARFVRTTFGRRARFERAVFGAQARFDGGTFKNAAWFSGATFRGPVNFQSVQCAEGLVLRWCRVEGKLAARVAATERIDLRRTVFAEPVSLSAATPRVQCDGAEFRAGANLFLRWAEVSLDDAVFRGTSALSGVSRLAGINEEPVVDALRGSDRAVSRSSAPRVTTALHADLEGVAFEEVDLARTRLTGAQNLDRARVSASVVLASTPRGPRIGPSLPPVWWWSRRQVLGEEVAWRAGGRKSSGWHAPGDSVRRPDGTDAAERGRGQRRREAERLASAYRDLRKGREELRNAPGAADLYYGEMEMRRHAARRIGIERAVLSAYWLVSGYGLRAGRAMTWLIVTLALAAGCLQQFGFTDVERPFADASNGAAIAPAGSVAPQRSPGRLPKDADELADAFSAPEAWVYAAAAAVPGAAPPRARLTTAGQAITVALRVLGPFLLGLALFSIRGRLKRG